MIYTAIRLSVDILYWVGRSSVDGVYYMLYGHQATEQERLMKYIQTLESRIEEKTLVERANNKLLHQLAKLNNIEREELYTEVDATMVEIH